MPTIIGQSTGGSVIKSIQRGSETFTTQTRTVTITAVDPDKSFLVINSAIDNTSLTNFCTGELTNATTVTLSKGANTGQTSIVKWQVIEFN